MRTRRVKRKKRGGSRSRAWRSRQTALGIGDTANIGWASRAKKIIDDTANTGGGHIHRSGTVFHASSTASVVNGHTRMNAVCFHVVTV